MWSFQVPDLVDAGFRCVTFDRRGHGRSDQARSGYELDTLADDLGAVIDGLDLHGVILVGHSMGAQEVIHYLARHGTRRAAGVVLSAPATPILRQGPTHPNGIPEAAFEAQRTAIRRDLGTFVDATSGADYFGAVEVSRHLDAWTRRTIVETPLYVLLETHRTYTRADLRDSLASIAIPALVIQGAADKSAPLEITGRPTAALLRNNPLVMIDNAGHGVYASQAARYNRELVRFASQIAYAQ
jgi:pimeloyl-ACP methyl ester carboxylesterase